MTTKRIKRKKIKFKNIFLFLLMLIIILLISFFIYTNIINTKIKNIYIVGNNYVSDIEIIRKAKLESYPKLLDISNNNIKSNIKDIELIKSVKVIKRLFGKITIKVEEYTPLFYNSKNNKIILDNAKEVEYNYINNLPILNTDNISDENLIKKLVKKFSDVDNNIKLRISEIKYDPNRVDDERFLCIMNDGNYVYVTLVKIDEINYYLKILPTLEDKKGILNLDYGNNFEIIE